MIVCSRNTVRASSHISFFRGGDRFCEVVLRPENTPGKLTGLPEWPAGLSLRLRNQRIPPTSLEQPEDLLFQSKISDLILPLYSHAEIWISSSPTYFSVYVWLSQFTYSWVFFPVICWSYLWTEISVTLSIGKKLYSRHNLLFFSFLWDHFVDVILRQRWIC